MPRVYLHMANTDLYEKIEEAYGGKPSKPWDPQTVSCARCQRANHLSQRLCGWCGSPLHQEDMARQSIELEEMTHRDDSKVLVAPRGVGDEVVQRALVAVPVEEVVHRRYGAGWERS
jgi:hypothetical protein